MENKAPHHLGIIMDGNRRWARERGLPAFEGHRRGYNKVKEVLRWCKDAGVKIITVFAFSIENWQRSKKEVDFLMRFLHSALTKDINEVHKENFRLKVIGRIGDLSARMQKAVKEAEALTKENTAGILNLAISYGGRDEIAYAVNEILKTNPKNVTAEMISANIHTAGLPDPDLIIRTSGEQRLSGFLLWQSAYSELYFCRRYWPAFSRKDFDAAMTEYSRRERRFGK